MISDKEGKEVETVPVKKLKLRRGGREQLETIP